MTASWKALFERAEQYETTEAELRELLDDRRERTDD